MQIRIIDWNELSEDERARVMRRSEQEIRELVPKIAPIVEAVRTGGDQAVLEFTRTLDHADLSGRSLSVSENEREAAIEGLDKRVRAAIDYAISNVERFHQRQAVHDLPVQEVARGIAVGERVHPLDSVGLYVPRGRGSFPSMLYMLAVPARIAGVPRVAVATPPDQEGNVDPACLYAAAQCGVTEIYRIGGAHAVAAFAYGTESIRPVAKIVGPGSAYVTAAKQVVRDVVDVGLPAGPSESMILADETADADTVAWDLLIEGEHGSDSSALLVTTSRELANEVAERISSLITETPEPRATFLRDGFARYGSVIVVSSLAEAARVVNRFAPEHLQIRTADPDAVLEQIVNAAEILVGRHTAFSLANYAAGSNAVLPTGGAARVYSGVSVRDFVKYSSVVRISEDGFAAMREHVSPLARYEGFYWHAEALDRRE